jgi:hypothetical protein
MQHFTTDHTIELKLKKLYHKDKASIEELLNSRAGRNLLPYEIVFNDQVDWEKLKDSVPELSEYYHKACVIYSNYRYLIRRKTPLPTVKEKIQQEDVRKFFEVLRALEL